MANEQHRICYAYPSSPLARAMRRNGSGCYVVTLGKAAIPHATYAAALAHAAALGTAPQRWSMDHPDNVQFLPG